MSDLLDMSADEYEFYETLIGRSYDGPARINPPEGYGWRLIGWKTAEHGTTVAARVYLWARKRDGQAYR